MFRHPLTVAAAGYVANPVFVFEIPAHGFVDAAVERLEWLPVEFALDFVCIDCIAPVMAGPIFDEGGEFVVGHDGVVRPQLVEKFTDGIDNLQIGFFATPTDIVSFSDAAAGEDGADGAAVILYVEPVANILAVAIDWERFAGASVQDHERNQFFGETGRARNY